MCHYNVILLLKHIQRITVQQLLYVAQKGIKVLVRTKIKKINRTKGIVRSDMLDIVQKELCPKRGHSLLLFHIISIIA